MIALTTLAATQRRMCRTSEAMLRQQWPREQKAGKFRIVIINSRLGE